MNEHAFLMAIINARTNTIEGYSIYSERNPTTHSRDTLYGLLVEGHGKNYSEAVQSCIDTARLMLPPRVIADLEAQQQPPARRVRGRKS